MCQLNVILSGILYAVTFIMIIFGVYSWKKRESQGAKALVILCLAACIYTFGYGMELISPTFEQADFWGKFKYIGLAFIPAIWVLLGYSFSRKIQYRYRLFLLLLIPIVTVIFRFTNEWHYLFYSKVSFTSNGFFNVIKIEKGPWYYIQHIYFLFCIIFSARIYYKIYKEERGIYKNQAIILIIASMLPVVTIGISFAGQFLLCLDSGSIVVFFTNILMIYGIFRYKFMNIIPLSRKTVFEWIHDGVLVFDLKYNLLDYNCVAKDIFPELERNKIGLPIDVLLSPYESFISIINMWISKTATEIYCGKVNNYIKDTYKFSICREGECEVKDYQIRIKSLSNRNSIIGVTVMITDITIQNQILRDLEEAAQTDYLTKLLNRRYFFEVVNYEIKRACRLKEGVALIILDIDYFKHINDTWGHQVGDKVLREIAGITKNNVREVDFVGRYGGEEFIIFLPCTLAKEAFQVAERLREQIEGHEVILDNEVIQVTASFGVSELQCDEVDFKCIEKIIKCADEALYKAKKMGRNRVEVFSKVIK